MSTSCLSCLFVRYDADTDVYYCPYRRIVQDGDWQGDDKPCGEYREVYRGRRDTDGDMDTEPKQKRLNNC